MSETERTGTFLTFLIFGSLYISDFNKMKQDCVLQMYFIIYLMPGDLKSGGNKNDGG